MAKPGKAVLDFMAQYKVDSDEIWEVHGSTWVVKHKALERVAAEVGILWERPTILESNSLEGIAAICVFGKLGERTEWSIGEAAIQAADRPWGNYKVSGKQAAYVYAMAEKRAKDRVILKLLTAHGALYSEAEADEFEQRQNPHTTRPEDVFDQPDYDQNGQPIDNIPMVDGVKALPKKDSRQAYKNLQDEMQKHTDAMQLQKWAETIPERVALLPADWAAIFRGQYKEHLAHLRNGNGRAA